MLTHLLFSISAILFMIIFSITYFSYKKNTNSVRSKIYVYMIRFTFILILTEILEGISYVYNISIIFNLMWKLHSIFMVLFVGAYFYYLFVTTTNQNDNIENLLWDSHKFLTIKNIFTIIFVISIIFSIVYVKAYPIGLTMFYFYTNESINFLLFLYLIFILYNIYIFYLKSKNNYSDINDYIVLIGTFILFVVALIFEYNYAEISIYSTLFTLVLILIYYFKENEDLLIIEKLKQDQTDLSVSNDLDLNRLHEQICDLGTFLKTFRIANEKLENSTNLTDDELMDNIICLNYISNNLGLVLNNGGKNSKYRIDELVLNIEKIVKLNLSNEAVKFAYSIDPNIPSVLVGNYRVIERIIINLIMNALKYTNVGKINLIISGERRKDNYILNIKVSDTGVGIKEEDFDKVFKNNHNGYYNVDAILPFIKKNVEALNGNINFDSHYGAGTTFYVSIPQNIYNGIPISQVPMMQSDIKVKDYHNKKVLILDNEDYSAKKLSSILNKLNFVTKCVKSGKEAIKIIKCDEGYDLIIVNDNIVDINFVEIGQLFKNLKKFTEVPPFIALIVSKDIRYINNIYDNYLLKPLNIKELNEIAEKLLG